jgi:nucleoside-diphosphate-sugar epimerase
MQLVVLGPYPVRDALRLPGRQAIADAWPEHVDDAAARSEWGWKPEYDLPRMTVEMIERLGARLRPAG